MHKTSVALSKENHSRLRKQIYNDQLNDKFTTVKDIVNEALDKYFGDSNDK